MPNSEQQDDQQLSYRHLPRTATAYQPRQIEHTSARPPAEHDRRPGAGQNTCSPSASAQRVSFASSARARLSPATGAPLINAFTTRPSARYYYHAWRDRPPRRRGRGRRDAGAGLRPRPARPGVLGDDLAVAVDATAHRRAVRPACRSATGAGWRADPEPHAGQRWTCPPTHLPPSAGRRRRPPGPAASAAVAAAEPHRAVSLWIAPLTWRASRSRGVAAATPETAPGHRQVALRHRAADQVLTIFDSGRRLAR